MGLGVFSKWLPGATLCAVFLALVNAASPADAQNRTSQPPASTRSDGPGTAGAKANAVAEKHAPVPNDASHQGFAVHGHWTIEVRNPDGTLAQHREFENSEVDEGYLLSGALGGGITAGEPMIVLSNTSGANFCSAVICAFNQYANGGITATGYCQQVGILCAQTLVPTVGFLQIANVYVVSLSAQATATSNGSVNTVATAYANCTVNGIASVSNLSCAQQTNLPAGTTTSLGNPNGTVGSDTFFTSTTISPITINAGQLVQVTVVFSFS